MGSQDQAAGKGPEPGMSVWMAIDMSRTKLVYCMRWEGSERRLSTPMELASVRAEVERYRHCRLHVAYEACGFGYELAWWLKEQGIAVTVIAPSSVERAPGRQVKTDRIDAGKLARKLELGELKGIYVPTRLQHQQRQVLRTWRQCAKERKRAQTQIRTLLQEHGRLGPDRKQGWAAYRRWLEAQQLPEPLRQCVKALQELRSVAEAQEKALRQQALELARSQAYRGLVKALCQQPGIGWISALQCILELGDIERFPTTDSLPHYLGLTPAQYSSGELDHRGRILKCGPVSLRLSLVQCAKAAVRSGKDADLRAMFERLSPRIGWKKARVAVARRLAIKMRQRWMAYERATTPPTQPQAAA
jgi:transposase